MHSQIFLENTVYEDILLAKEAGFDGIEIYIPRLLHDLKEGTDIGLLNSVLGNMNVLMLDALLGIELMENYHGSEFIAHFERVCTLAVQLNCGAIQVVVLDGLNYCRPHERILKIKRSLSILADLAWSHRIRLAIEPVCFSAFRSLQDVLDVVASVGSDRVGMILDTWHLWISKVCPKEISALDPRLIMGAHLGDSKPRQGAVWSDDARGALPGKGIVPMGVFVDAIKDSGYSGWWTVEVHGRSHFKEMSARQLAYAMYQSAINLLN